MPRMTQMSAVLAKLETAYATDSVPAGGANAIVCSEPSFELLFDSKERNVSRPHFGAQQAMHNSRFARLSFDVENAPSGVAGTPPAFGPLLRASAKSETITATTRVEYAPITLAQESVTIYYYLDGVLHKLLGAMGSVEKSGGEGEIPLLKFQFTGIDGGIVEGALPNQTLTAWKTPQLISGAVLKFGGTYSAGALTGGTAFPSRGLSLNLGNDVKTRRMLSGGSGYSSTGQAVNVMGRKASGSVQLELTAAQEVALIADINSGVLTSMSFEYGSVAGSKTLVFCPSVQRLAPKRVDYEGVAQLGLDLALLPVNGNDELRLVFS